MTSITTGGASSSRRSRRPQSAPGVGGGSLIIESPFGSPDDPLEGLPSRAARQGGGDSVVAAPTSRSAARRGSNRPSNQLLEGVTLKRTFMTASDAGRPPLKPVVSFPGSATRRKSALYTASASAAAPVTDNEVTGDDTLAYSYLRTARVEQGAQGGFDPEGSAQLEETQVCQWASHIIYLFIYYLYLIYIIIIYLEAIMHSFMYAARSHLVLTICAYR
jgi:hypothetical protein